ncbi:MAG: YfcE family phosphodiesterase [Firmicutes bacterium]|nr:YfcE family phosphodiesterase [Bacillota bacterium]
MEYKLTKETGSIAGYLKIVVISDTHGTNEILDQLREKYEDAYAFVHCGDLEEDPRYYDRWVFVRGNNDYYSGFKDIAMFKAGKHKIYIEHSHMCPYRKRTEALARKAKDKGCDIVLYGHTHCSKIEMVNDILTINPGSSWWPRDGKEPSYALLYVGDQDCLINLIFKKDWNLEN